MLVQYFGQSLFIQRFKVLTDGASTKRRIARLELFVPRYVTLPPVIRFDYVGVHSKAFVLDQTCVHAAT